LVFATSSRRLVLLVDSRRVDRGEQRTGLDGRAIVHVPLVHVPADLGIDRRGVPGLDIARQRDRSRGRAWHWHHDLHLRYRLVIGERLEIRDIVVAFDDAVDDQAPKDNSGDKRDQLRSNPARVRDFAIYYVHR
jgi:hypothetical protein